MTPPQLVIALIATIGGLLFIFGLWRWAARQSDEAQRQHEHDLAEQDGCGDYEFDIETGKKKPLR